MRRTWAVGIGLSATAGLVAAMIVGTVTGQNAAAGTALSADPAAVDQHAAQQFHAAGDAADHDHGVDAAGSSAEQAVAPNEALDFAAAGPRFRVPFECGEVWLGGTRADHSPANAIDFNHSPDEGWKVTASAAGTVKQARNLGNRSYGKFIEIEHAGGYSTIYAHLSTMMVSEDQPVKVGQVIGRVGNTGNSFGAHLHYEQKRGGSAIRATFYGNQPAHYWGKKNYKVNCDGGGDEQPPPSDGAHRFPAKADLDGRQGPSKSSKTLKVNAYRKGQQVPVVCQTKGDTAYGSKIWDKTKDGYFVTDVYVKTGTDGFAPGVPRCKKDNDPEPKPDKSKAFKVKADLNGRNAPSLQAKTVKEDAYRQGTKVTVVCQTEGAFAYGSKIWDKTAEGYYVTDAYVLTGTNGFVDGLPRCTDVPDLPEPPGNDKQVRGLDTSNYQAGKDMAAQAAKGRKFNIIKASEGSTYVDPSFGKLTKASRSAGMITGAYHFANPAGASGKVQAQWFIQHGGGWTDDGKTLPGALDLESGCYGKSPSEMIAWIKDFADTYRSRTGRDVMIYTTRGWWSACTGNTQKFSANPLWMVALGSQSRDPYNGWSKATFIQTAFGELGGQDGMDQDIFLGSLKQLKAFAANGTAPKDKPADEPDPKQGRKFPAKADLNGRNAPSLDAKTVKENAYRKGDQVTVVCQTKGADAYGSNIWDKTAEGYYVADHYVKTGVDGFVSALPKCKNVPDLPKPPKSDWASPVPQHAVITARATYPSSGSYHGAIDYSGFDGKFTSACNGVVDKVDIDPTYGNKNAYKVSGSTNYIWVNCGGGIRIGYAHWYKRDLPSWISNGAKVKAGQPLAKVGNQGNSSGQHLHFQVERNGHAIDGHDFLKSKGVKGLPKG